MYTDIDACGNWQWGSEHIGNIECHFDKLYYTIGGVDSEPISMSEHMLIEVMLCLYGDKKFCSLQKLFMAHDTFYILSLLVSILLMEGILREVGGRLKKEGTNECLWLIHTMAETNTILLVLVVWGSKVISLQFKIDKFIFKKKIKSRSCHKREIGSPVDEQYNLTTWT